MLPPHSHLVLFPAELSVFREVSPPPKLKASALIWSRKCESTTGSPTGVKRKPSGRSWPWMQSLLRATASTLCSLMAHRIIPRPALHLQVRCQVVMLCKRFGRLHMLTSAYGRLDDGGAKGAWFHFLWCKTILRKAQRLTVDVIREPEKDRTSDQWAWVSELSEWHCYSDLWKHWEQSTLYLQSPLQSQHGEAWYKGQQPCDRPGSGQGHRRGNRHHLNVPPSFPHFLLPSSFLRTHGVAKTRRRLWTVALTISPCLYVCIQTN